MPEGDTIFRAARTLNEVLAGKKVTQFETVLPRLARIDDQQPIAGRTIEGVTAAGKNLIIDFSGDLHLRTHMRMNGSWHIYRAGERWRRRRTDMRIVIGTTDFVAVAFNVPVAEFHDKRRLAQQDDLRRMGPDLLGEDFDIEEALQRIRARTGDEIGNALLNQRVVAGIGNIYKSETLFLVGINPFERVDAIADADLKRALNVAGKLFAPMRGEIACGSTAGALSPATAAGASSNIANRAPTPAERTGARGARARKIAPDMAIILSRPVTPQEIRVLQEFRRIAAETMPITAIAAIKHPVGGGEAPAFSLVDKGYLTTDAARQNFTLTEKGKEFLSYDPKPESETATPTDESAVE